MQGRDRALGAEPIPRALGMIVVDGPVEPIVAGLVDDPERGPAGDRQADVDRPAPVAAREVPGPVDGVDHPDPVVATPARLRRALFGQDRVVGKVRAQGRDDRRLDRQVRPCHGALVVGLVGGLKAVVTTGLDLERDRSAAANHLDGDLEFMLEHGHWGSMTAIEDFLNPAPRGWGSISPRIRV
ncbi:hypothetical protein ENSA5_50710 [Enhygromyxa salina]|uniref:Uncharacterized protein n=1 Tax=Enhygromyxa salina TaxID=215803 RepID=A0A2S9XGW8_9BACT|nr:hypothetical protein ENSA5_50710 [Enhygromyxa salina]